MLDPTASPAARFPRRTAAAILLLAVAILAGACTQTGIRRLSPPEAVPTTPTSSTSLLDYSAVVLPAAPGATTTTIELGPGSSRLAGTVTGPEGPVGSAIVRIERLVGDGAAVAELLTFEDGTWELPDILGGRYRVRAWRAPDLALIEPQIFLLRGGEERDLAIVLTRYQGTFAEAAFSPEAPFPDEPVIISIRIIARAVDEQGVVRSAPQPGVEVELRAGARWRIDSMNPVTTDGEGVARFRITCRSPGTHPLAVVLEGVDQLPIGVPNCEDPDTTSTTEPPEEEPGE